MDIKKHFLDLIDDCRELGNYTAVADEKFEHEGRLYRAHVQIEDKTVTIYSHERNASGWETPGREEFILEI